MAFGENDVNVSALKQQFRRFETVVIQVEKKAVKALQAFAPAAQADVVAAYEAEKVYTATGASKAISNYRPPWGAKKRRMGYDSRRGHATGGIAKALKRKSVIKKTKKGFVLDFESAANATKTRYRNRPKGVKARKFKSGYRAPATRSVTVGKYINHFAHKKAPTLGEISRGMRSKIAKGLEDAIGKDLRNLRKSAEAGGLATGGNVFAIRINSFGLGRRA